MAVLAMALVAGGMACERARGTRELHVGKQRLGVLPDPEHAGTLRVDDEGRDWAVILGTLGNRRLVRNGVELKGYRDVSEANFAPNGDRMLYWAIPEDPAATGLLLVDGDTILRTPAARPGQLVFSEDGKHWATAAGIGLGDPFAVASENRLAEPTRGPVVVLHDGREIGRHADTSPVALDATGTHVAYLARDDEGRVSVVVDGVISAPFERPPGAKPPAVDEKRIGPTLGGWYSVRYLSDGSILSVADHAEGWAVRRDGRELATYAWAAQPFPAGVEPATPEGGEGRAAFIPPSLVTAAEAPVAVWWERPAGGGKQWRLVRDGQPVDEVLCGRPWDYGRPLLSADGEHVAYVCIDVEPQHPGDVAPRETMWVVHDGKRLGPYASVWGLSLTKDGEHVVYAVLDAPTPEGRWRFHRDGVPFGKELLETWPVRLGDDGRTMATQGRGLDDQTRLMFDGLPVGRFDQVLWGPSFVGPEAVAWVIRRGDTLWRVEAWRGDERPS